MEEDRLIAIETKLAHQERLVEELDRVITDQQDRITRLEELCRTLTERLRAAETSSGRVEPGDERPPHY